MEKHSLYFIHKGRQLDSITAEFTKEVESYPNFDYLKTHTTVFGGQYWVVHISSLTNLPLHISKEPIEEVRKKEGIQGFGEGPRLKDVNGKVVFSIARLDQFYINPIPESRKADRDRLWGLRCLQIKDERIPLDFPISRILLDNPQKVFYDLKLLFEEIDSTIHVGLEARYKKPQCFESMTPGNIACPDASLSEFVQLQLVLKDAEFSEGSLDSLSVILEEHTTCPVAFEDEIRMLKDVRSMKICQKNINIDFTLRLFSSVDNSFTFPLQICGCKLPNLGPSFYSNNCARSYTLKFILSIKDPLNNLKVSALLNIDVALVDYKAQVGNVAHLRKERDFLHLEICDNSSAAHDISASVLKRISNLPWSFYGFQTIAAKRGDRVYAITIFNLSEVKIRDLSSLWFGQYRRQATIAQKNDFSLVPTGTCWEVRDQSLNTLDGTLQIAVSDRLAVFKSGYYPLNILHFHDLDLIATYLRGKYVLPGMSFESIVSLKVDYSGEKAPKVDYISIQLIEQTVRLTRSGPLSEKRHIHLAYQHEVKTTVYRNSSSRKWYSNICKVPNLAPTVYSSTFQRGYSISIRVGFMGGRFFSRQLEIVICGPKVRPLVE